MPHQVDRSGSDLLDEGDHVSDVLRHLVIVTDGVPMLGKEVPQADRDHAMRFRQRAEHGIPGAEIAERAVHADQRRAFSDFEISHVVAVDAKGLHARFPGSPVTERRSLYSAPRGGRTAYAGDLYI